MPTLTVPLVPSYNQRSFNTTSGIDQVKKGCILTRIVNQAQNSAVHYLEKRCGFSSQATVSAGATGYGCYYAPRCDFVVTASSATSVIWKTVLPGTSTNMGTMSGQVVAFNEVFVPGVTAFVMMTASDQTGWFLAQDAAVATFTADRSSGSATLANVSSFTGRYVGQLITGTGIPASTRILSMNSGSSTITMTANATSGSSTSTTITPEGIAKIIDSDFPSNIVGPFVELNGYIFVGTATGKVYNSDLNSIVSWTASAYIEADKASDACRGVFKYRELIGAAGTRSIDFFYNNGNPSGSPLSSSNQAIYTTGLAPSLTACRLLVANINDTVYFIGGDKRLYQLDGLTAKPLQTPQTFFTNGISIDTIYPFHFNGQNFLHFGFNSSAYDTWYSVDTGHFTQPALPANIHISSRDNVSPEVFFVLQSASGILYYFDPTTFTDGSGTNTETIQFETDMGTQKRKFVTEIRVNADAQSGGTYTVSYSDDDQASFSSGSSISKTTMKQRATRQGSFVGKRMWKLVDTSTTANRIKSIEIDYEMAEK